MSDAAGAPGVVPVPPARPGGRGGVLKEIVEGVAFLLVLPLLALYRPIIALAPGRTDATFQGFSQLLSIFPGLPGDYLRRAFYRRTLRRCARSCSIGFGTIFATPEVEIEEGVYIGAFGNIAHSIIGRDTLLGSNVTILAGKTQHNIDRLDIPVRFQGGAYVTVRVGEDVWIGNGAIVAEDVGPQAVIGAGAVVVKPVPPRAIVGGNPARVLGERGAAGRQAQGAAGGPQDAAPATSAPPSVPPAYDGERR